MQDHVFPLGARKRGTGPLVCALKFALPMAPCHACMYALSERYSVAMHTLASAVNGRSFVRIRASCLAS